MNVRTQYVRDLLKGFRGNIALSIYFKICLINRIKPTYRQFCTVIDIRYFDVQGGRIMAHDGDIEVKVLDKLMLQLYEDWKRNPFNPTEMKFISNRGIGGGIAVLMSPKS